MLIMLYLFSGSQVDITPQLQEKSIKAAQRYLAGKDVVANLFDEAQLAVFKELLPYWAGFRRGFQPPEDPAKRPGMMGNKAHTRENFVLKRTG